MSDEIIELIKKFDAFLDQEFSRLSFYKNLSESDLSDYDSTTMYFENNNPKDWIKNAFKWRKSREGTAHWWKVSNNWLKELE